MSNLNQNNNFRGCNNNNYRRFNSSYFNNTATMDTFSLRSWRGAYFKTILMRILLCILLIIIFVYIVSNICIKFAKLKVALKVIESV